MASSPFNTETLWTSAPASGGTQGTQKPREPLKNSKPAAPNRAASPPNSVEDTPRCPLPDVRHLGAESARCPENHHKPLAAGSGFCPTQQPPHS